MVPVDNQEQAEEVVQDAFAALYVRYRLVSTPLAHVRASVLNGGRRVLPRCSCDASLQPDDRLLAARRAAGRVLHVGIVDDGASR
jgi:hypothetical protein